MYTFLSNLTIVDVSRRLIDGEYTTINLHLESADNPHFLGAILEIAPEGLDTIDIPTFDGCDLKEWVNSLPVTEA